MKIIQNNEFMILNNIIYKIHTCPDLNAMRKELLEQIKMILDFDSADFYLSKGDGTTSLVSQVTYNCKYDLSKTYETLDYSQGILNGGKSMVYRETDILADGERVQTDYYKKVYQSNNWHYSMQMILAFNDEFLGVITFYRKIGKADFKYEDVFMLEILKEHLSYRLFREKEQKDKISIEETVEQFGLTKREQNILEFIMHGLSNEEICQNAIITNNTLKKHILNIYKKIGVKNRVQLFKLIK